jgi:murein DD-endopeptidase MepM/ murein hydrolase activator NlpD
MPHAEFKDLFMSLSARLARARNFLEARFPERHLYIRTDGEMRGMVLTTNRQVVLAAGASVIGLWTATSVVAMVMAMAAAPGPDAVDPKAAARALAQRIETRQANLEKLFTTITCQSTEPGAQAPRLGFIANSHAPADGLKDVGAAQDRLVAQAQKTTAPCTDRLRAAFRQAGVDPAAFAPPATARIITPPAPPRAGQPATHAANDTFTTRIQVLANELSEMHALKAATTTVPLARPTITTAESSGFGIRTDPFTGHMASHPGLDFPAPRMTPVFATAAGFVSYTGPRGGYGNVVEIDHGHGFKTRFAHLAALSVKAGQHVDIHQSIGAIGSTGRSTGPHLHYEVWVDGRPRNPEPFLRAGDYVHQTG